MKTEEFDFDSMTKEELLEFISSPKSLMMFEMDVRREFAECKWSQKEFSAFLAGIEEVKKRLTKGVVN